MEFDLEFTEQAKDAIAKRLDKRYLYIMNTVADSDKTFDAEFQKSFNGFYKVRNRQKSWYEAFYRVFNEMRFDKEISFDKIIYRLYDETGTICPSFSSKILASVKSEKPIWEQFVLLNLAKKKCYSTIKDRQLKYDIALYKDIEDWYIEILSTDKAREYLSAFDNAFEEYKNISPTKKIDFYLWTKRL